MANFTLQLNESTLQKLTEAAQKAGVTPERMAAMTLEAWVLASGDLPGPSGVSEPARAWVDGQGEGEDVPGDNGAGHEPNEVGRPWSEVRPEFVALIDKTFGKPE